MFQELTETLTCEVKALGYPKAALFGFCLALMAYHGVSVIKAASRAALGHETVEKNNIELLSIAGNLSGLRRHDDSYFRFKVENLQPIGASSNGAGS